MSTNTLIDAMYDRLCQLYAAWEVREDKQRMIWLRTGEEESAAYCVGALMINIEGILRKVKEGETFEAIEWFTQIEKEFECLPRPHSDHTTLAFSREAILRHNRSLQLMHKTLRKRLSRLFAPSRVKM